MSYIQLSWAFAGEQHEGASTAEDRISVGVDFVEIDLLKLRGFLACLAGQLLFDLGDVVGLELPQPCREVETVLCIEVKPVDFASCGEAEAVVWPKLC